MANFITNILNNFKKEEKDFSTEGAKEQKELLSITMDDKDLIREINADVRSSISLYSKMKGVSDENERYWTGEQSDRRRFGWELPSAENLLYASQETIISIITSKRKEPIVLSARDTDESRILANESQQFLTWKWNDEDMMTKYEDWVRHACLSRIGVLKVRFDINRDDFGFKVLRSDRIMIDKNATDELDSKFIVEFKEDTLGDLITMFADKEVKTNVKKGRKAKKDLKARLIDSFGKQMGTSIKYIEYWTNEFAVWKVGDIVLGKKKNPNWNWDETDRAGNLKSLRKRWAKKVKDEKLKNLLLNYFDEPRKPYIILSLKNLGKDIYGDTSDFEQGKRAQDIISRRKRQIDKAAVKARGREVYSGTYITKPEAKKSMTNPESPLWIKQGRASDAVTHIAPQPMSPIILQDLQESKAALDNVMGTHGTTRGERGAAETATGRNILREGDFGRIDLSVRRIDKKLELVYGWMMQMAKVYFTEKHFMKMLGKEGTVNYLKFSKDNIEDGQEILVKSELTVSKAVQKENANRKLEGGLIDPLTYLEKTDEPRPKELARRLMLYKLAPKLYIQQFLIDENTEGAENTPGGRAKQENIRIEKGEQVAPFKGADKVHIEAHNKRIKQSDFKELDIEVQNAFMEHVRGEIEIVKTQRQSIE